MRGSRGHRLAGTVSVKSSTFQSHMDASVLSLFRHPPIGLGGPVERLSLRGAGFLRLRRSAQDYAMPTAMTAPTTGPIK
jgi:hypothetical protein